MLMLQRLAQTITTRINHNLFKIIWVLQHLC